MHILIVEDDAETSSYLSSGLEEDGHVVRQVANGREGLSQAMAGNFDVLIVDRMLPGIDGLTLVEKLRSNQIETPVLILTTMSGIGDRVAGLNAGADDYLVKPFDFAELRARVNALNRRNRALAWEPRFKVSDLDIDIVKRVVRRAGKEIFLQPREFRLLEYLVRHTGEVVTRTMILESVWNYHFDTRTNIVESHLSRLRAKIDKGFSCELIHTVRGSGYCLRAP